MLDEVFGEENFQNELIWYYQTGGASRGRFSRKHDTILMYTNGLEAGDFGLGAGDGGRAAFVTVPTRAFGSPKCALRPASGPAPAPFRCAVKSWGTKAESDRATDMLTSLSALAFLSEIPIENLGTVPSDHAIST